MSSDRDKAAGSDLPARGQGVTADNANGAKDKAKGAAKAEPRRPDNYKGKHR
jgi:hypothetical protein